jgi:hypothetical protein
MLETVKGLLAEGAFVWAWQILPVVVPPNHAGHHGDGCHAVFSPLPFLFSNLPQSLAVGCLFCLDDGLLIQKTGNLDGGRCALHVIAAAAYSMIYLFFLRAGMRILKNQTKVR